jgi:hypothetical protein
MTLNITILTPQVIYQSADYALFDPRAGKPLLMPSTKAVVLSSFDWTGFITYTGIGRVGNKHTSEYVHEWVQNLDRPSFEDVVEMIRNRASLWVQAVKPGAPQTFVVAAFVDGLPTAAVVSNFQKWHGADSTTIDKDFAVSTVVAQGRTEVIVTGIRDAVPRPRRRALQRLAKEYSHDGIRVRRAMAEATRDGARRYPGRISEDCFVYSQDSGGQGHYEVMGTTRTENPMSMGGPDANRLVRNLLDKGFGRGQWSLVGMTSANSQNQSAPPAPCALVLATGPSSTRYRIVDLATPDGRRATPRSINADGIIVGEGSPLWRGPSYPCYWPQQSHVEFLPHGGGLGGAAHDINDSGVIVGSSEWPDRASHACTWNLDVRASDIGETIARHSQAKALNASRSIVGWISIHPTEGGQAHFRPAYWPKSGSPVILDNLAGGWGEAVDINSMGIILVRVHKGGDIAASGEAGAWLWDGAQTIEIGKPSSDFASFYPHRVTDERRVVGLTIRKDGQRCGAVRSVNGTWSPLFTPTRGRELTAVNRQLLIAGYDLVNDYRVPWVKEEGREMTYLPHYKYHHHITMVSEQGWAVGTASADNCCHPLLWILT